jgi:hypothetical protein
VAPVSNDRAKRIDAVRRRIVPVSESDPWIKALGYGLNGAGKTRWGATAPKCLLIDIDERGTRSVANYPGVKVFHAVSWADVTFAYWFLRDGNHDFESVCIDNLTTMQNLCLKFVLKENADRDPNKDPTVPVQRDWGKLAQLMRPVILNYRNLDMHVVFLAQERVIEIKDEDDGGVLSSQHVPDLTPGSRGTVMGAVGFIGRIYQREVTVKVKGKEVTRVEPRMLLGHHESYITKDRTGSLGRILRNPTVPKIIEANNDTTTKE